MALEKVKHPFRERRREKREETLSSSSTRDALLTESMAKKMTEEYNKKRKERKNKLIGPHEKEIQRVFEKGGEKIKKEFVEKWLDDNEKAVRKKYYGRNKKDWKSLTQEQKLKKAEEMLCQDESFFNRQISQEEYTEERKKIT